MYSDFPDFDNHALVASWADAASGLAAIIVIHNASRGPALGGCRMYPYRTIGDAVTDALRLSRGMTYKNAIANIPYGGGKAVIIGNPRTQKSAALLRSMGDFVQSLSGRYVTSFDSGTNMDDLLIMGERTKFVAGLGSEMDDASASTALGVFQCMRVAAEEKLGRADLTGVRIAIQGVGNVGSRLAHMLAESGAALIIADVDADRAGRVAHLTGATLADHSDILFADVDIISPCALGSIATDNDIPKIQARIVAGAANNQLASSEQDAIFTACDILYCPDYLVNAGGIINLHYQRTSWSRDAVDKHVLSLGDALRGVINRSRATGAPTSRITDEIAESRFKPAARAM